MSRQPLGAAALALCLLALGACRKPDEAMQTVVLIYAEPGVRDAIATSRGSVFLKSAGDNTLLNTLKLPPPHDWPIKFVLAPKGGDASRRFAVTLTAYDPKDAPLFGFEVTLGFVAGHTRTVQLRIADSCVAAGSDCRLGCDPIDVPAEDLEAAADVQVPITCLKQSSSGTATGGAGAAGAGAAGSEAELGNGIIGVGGVAGRGPSAGASGSAAAGSGGSSPRSGGQGAPPPTGGGAAPPTNTPDACAMNVCGEHGKCSASGSCECELGYASEAAGKPCADIDECQQDPARCGPGTCQNLDGDFACACGEDAWAKPDRHGCRHIGTALSLTPAYRSSVPCQPQVAFFGASAGTPGKGLAVWVTGDSSTQALWTASFDPATGMWTLANVPVVAGTATLDAPRLALNAQTGDGYVMWLQNSSGKGEVRYAVRSAGRFGPPRTLTLIEGRTAQFLSAVLSASGDGYASWSEVDSSFTRSRVVAARLNRITQTWLGTETIAGADDSGYNAVISRLAVDAKGRALLVWTAASVGDGGTPSFIGKAYWARYEPASPGWDPRSPLDALGSGLVDVALDKTDANGGGQGMAIWQHAATPAGGQAVAASVFTPEVRWGKPAMLGTASEPSFMLPRVGVMSGGNAFALWTQQAGGALSVWSAVYDAGKSQWNIPTRPLSPQGATFPPSTSEWAGIYFDLTDVAVDEQGGAVGVFSDFSGPSRVIRAVHVQPDSLELHGPIEVKRDTTPLPPSRVEVGLDAQGNGALIWDQPLSADLPAYQVFVSRIE